MLITTALAAPLTGVTQLVASGNEACALDEAGDLWCWGEEPRASRRAASVSAVASPSCWVHRDGRLACGELRSQPFPPGVLTLVSRDDRACALGTDGLVSCVGDWAEAYGGPRGTDPERPTTVAGLEGAVELTSWGCVRRGDGEVVCATPRGPRPVENVRAMALMDTRAGAFLIDTERIVRSIPNLDKVESDASSFTKASGIWPDTCKVDAGQLWCWSSRDARVAIPYESQGPIVLGRELGCAVGTDRTVACWGETTVRWWGEGVAVPWPAVEGATEAARPWFSVLLDDPPMPCALEDRQVRCESPWPFNSVTAPPLVLEDIDALATAMGQACATRGTTLLCFGQHWLGYSDAGPGVIQFTEVADFAMDDDELDVVGADGRVRRFFQGEEIASAPLDAVQIVLGSEVGCVRRRDAPVLCWSREWPSELHPLGLPPQTRVDKLVLRGESVCVSGTRWCAEDTAPVQSRPVVVEVAP